MSATPSIAVTIPRCSGEKWYPIMPASASDRPMTPKGIAFKVISTSSNLRRGE